jgi:putative lipoprotein
MTKILKDICKIIICLISILFISACSSQEKNEKSSNKKESYQYTIYNANADIHKFEFIHDKNGIIVEWDFENNKVAKAINSSDWIRVNPNFLVRERQKLRRATASKEMKSDEFAYLDIFDLTNKKAPKKEIDVWKLMVNYLKNDQIEFHGTLPILRKIGNNDYVVLSITEQKKYRYFLLNLRTLKIDAEKTEQELNVTNQIDIRLFTDEKNRSGVEPFDNGFWKSQNYNGDINLKHSDPSAFNLFSKKDSFAYKVIQSENGAITNGKELIELEAEFLKTGVSVYDELYLPGKWSTEGQDTKIVSYEDIQKYYNGKFEAE